MTSNLERIRESRNNSVSNDSNHSGKGAYYRLQSKKVSKMDAAI
jgi:hypothetical protein